MFIITIDTDNATFDDARKAREVASMLRRIADHMDDSDAIPFAEYSINDLRQRQTVSHHLLLNIYMGFPI